MPNTRDTPTEPIGILPKIAKIIVDMDQPDDVADFLAYISNIIRKRKRVIVSVQVED